MSLLKQIVEMYGVHRHKSDGIYWLLQQSESINSIGLPPKQCPFRIKTNLMMCPHNFDISVASGGFRNEVNEYERLLADSPILQFLDPANTPKVKTLYVETDSPKDYHALTVLQGLLNPSLNVANPADMAKDIQDVVLRRLRSSNLSTYLVYGINSTHGSLISDLATTASMSNGRLLFAGPRLPFYDMGPILTRTPIEPKTLDWANKTGRDMIKIIGAIRLKRHMRT